MGEGGGLDFERGQPWLNVVLYRNGDGDGNIPAAYFDAMIAMADTIHNDPRWRAWWSGAEQRELTISVNYSAKSGRGSVTARGGRTWASFRMEESRFRGRGAGALAHLAHTDLATVFARVSTALDMPVPGDIPRPADATAPTPENVASRERLADLRKRHRTQPQP